MYYAGRIYGRSNDCRPLQGKATVIADSTTGIGFAAAKLFVEEGANVFITGRRQKELEETAKAIGDNATGVQEDVSKLAELIGSTKPSMRKGGECHR